MAKLMDVTDDINALLDELGSGRAPDRGRLEHTLTDGYAWALKLDGECGRLERRMADVAALIGGDDDGKHATELSRVSRRLSRCRRDLAELRQLLNALRSRRAQTRVA